MSFLRKFFRSFDPAAIVLITAAAVLFFFTADETNVSGNMSSRLALLESLGDRGVFNIDGSLFETFDKGAVNGRFYSDKPMLYTLALVPAYLAGKIFGFSFQSFYHSALFWVNLWGGTAIAAAVMLILYFRLKRSMSRFAAASMSALGVFGTWIFTYSGCVNNHTPSALALLCLYLCLENIGGEKKLRGAALAGAAAGILVCLEIPTGLIFGVLAGLYILLKCGRERFHCAAAFAALAVLPSALMSLCGFFAYGSFLPLYMVKGAYDYPGCIQGLGIAGLKRPPVPWLYPVDMLFWQRGYFSYMPQMLLIFPAFWAVRKGLAKLTPPAFFLAGTVCCMVFYALMTGDYGGWAYGFRFLIPVIPVMWLIIAEWLVLKAGRFWRAAAVPLLCAGLIISLIGAYCPWLACYKSDRSAINCIKLNLYCFAYEYAPDSWLMKNIALPLVSDIKALDAYTAIAFHNMKKTLPGENPSEVKIVFRKSVAVSLLGACLPGVAFAKICAWLIFYCSSLCSARRVFLPLLWPRAPGSWPLLFLMLWIQASLLCAVIVGVLGFFGFFCGLGISCRGFRLGCSGLEIREKPLAASAFACDFGLARGGFRRVCVFYFVGVFPSS